MVAFDVLRPIAGQSAHFVEDDEVDFSRGLEPLNEGIELRPVSASGRFGTIGVLTHNHRTKELGSAKTGVSWSRYRQPLAIVIGIRLRGDIVCGSDRSGDAQSATGQG